MAKKLPKPLGHAHKTTLKRYDGSTWIPVYLTSSSDIVLLGEDVEVVGKHGAFEDGELVPASTPVQTVLKKLLRNLIPPVYETPTVKIFLSTNKMENTAMSGDIYIESGTKPDGFIVSQIMKGDEGDLIRHEIFRMGENNIPFKLDAEPGDGQTHPENNRYYTPNENDVIEDQVITYYSEYEYGQGPIKQDNFNEDYPNGRIEAGTVKSELLRFIPMYNIYYGHDSKGITVPIKDPAEIYALNNGADNPDPDTGNPFFASKDQDVQKEIEFTMYVPIGTTRVTVAYPHWVKLPRFIVLYDGGGNGNIAKIFGTSQVMMNNLRIPTKYTVKTISWDQPLPDDVIFKIQMKKELQEGLI